MKKYISLIALSLVVLFCACGHQKINGITLNEGDTKTYETKDYIIVYKVDFFNGLGAPRWVLDKIINKTDTTYVHRD